MNSNVTPISYVTVEDHLADEEEGIHMRDYIAGVVWDAAHTDGAHDMIRSNLAIMFFREIGTGEGKPFFFESTTNVKVRLQPQGGGFVYFYHPDMAIACDPSDNHGRPWRERPTVLFEVISENTRQIDEREKRLAYFQFASLEAYVRIEQNRPAVVIERRTLEGWRIERLVGLKAAISLPFLKLEIPLEEVYAGIDLPSTARA